MNVASKYLISAGLSILDVFLQNETMYGIKLPNVVITPSVKWIIKPDASTR
jgi:hypothetical protein